jgi:hypothetical protein
MKARISLRGWWPIAVLSFATLVTTSSRAQTFGVDVRTSVSATSSTSATRLFMDATRTPAPIGSRVWFVIDANGDGVPATPTPGAVLGPDDFLALEDVVAGQLPGNSNFAGRYSRNGLLLPDAYRNQTNVYVYLWQFAAPLTEVPRYDPPAGASFGMAKCAATPKPEFGNAIWRVAEDVFANARTVGGGGGDLPPTITTQPQSQSVKSGQRAEFTVAATGTAPLEYQWRKDTTVIVGATNATFSIAAVTADDAGAYTVVVRNAAGSRTSEPATLTVLPPPPPPQIAVPSISTENGDVFLNLSFATVGGASYQVQSTTNLAAQPVMWTNEGSAVPGTGALVSIKIQIGSGGQINPPQKFLRILAE